MLLKQKFQFIFYRNLFTEGCVKKINFFFIISVFKQLPQTFYTFNFFGTSRNK